MNPGFARTPEPPYYAVIFTAERTAVERGYGETAQKMMELAARQPGYLGVEHIGDPATGLSVTISYWDSLEAIAGWKKQEDHRIAQQRGHQEWYQHFELRVAKVERAYSKPG